MQKRLTVSVADESKRISPLRERASKSTHQKNSARLINGLPQQGNFLPHTAQSLVATSP